MTCDPPRLHVLDPEVRRLLLDRLRFGLADLEGVRLVWCHGSFARGESFRDLDIAVLPSRNADWRAVQRAGQRVWELLDRPEWDIDSTSLADAPPSFRRAVVTEGELLYEVEPGLGEDFAVMYLSEYEDWCEWKRTHELREEERHGSTSTA